MSKYLIPKKCLCSAQKRKKLTDDVKLYGYMLSLGAELWDVSPDFFLNLPNFVIIICIKHLKVYKTY